MPSADEVLEDDVKFESDDSANDVNDDDGDEFEVACEQALIFVVIIDVARAAKRELRVGERSEPARGLAPLAGSLRSPTRNSRLRRSRHIDYNNENESLLAG